MSIARVKIPSKWFQEEAWRVNELRDAGYDTLGDETPEDEVEYLVPDDIAYDDLMSGRGPAERGYD